MENYFVHGIPCISIFENKPESIDNIFEYAKLKHCSASNSLYNKLVTNVKIICKNKFSTEIINDWSSRQNKFKCDEKDLPFRIKLITLLHKYILNCGGYYRSGSYDKVISNLLFMLFGSDRGDVYSNYLYQNIIQSSIFEELIISNKILRKELDIIKINNNVLTERVRFLESNLITSYDYEKIKNRKMALHKELKRIYRLLAKRQYY